MNADRIMDALGNVNEDYIMEAAPGKRKENRAKLRWIAAMAVVIITIAFFRTAPGAAALEAVKETVTNFIEILFPPKEIVAHVEGETEVLPHAAGGKEPLIQDDGAAAIPGFAIYYDAEQYVMTEENGAAYIRPIMVMPTREEIGANHKALLEGLTDQEAETKINELLAQQEEFYANLPVCEIEIMHLPDMEPASAAQTTRDQAANTWERVTEVAVSELPVGYFFCASTGESWNSLREQVHFISDGQDGTYKISVRYFFEAAEGHGARFMYMLQTFEVIVP